MDQQSGGISRLEWQLAGLRMQTPMLVASEPSAPVRAAADHMRAAFEAFKDTGSF